MALKIWLNNSMKKIDTNLHKPVTFINGTKYKLDKAWTFVNGEKKQIWGETGVQIDYISSTGTLSCGTIFCIGETWACGSYNKNVYRIDISNLNNPTLITNPVAWGVAGYYSSYLSNGTDSIFHAYNSTNSQVNRLKVDINGNVSAIKSFNYSGSSLNGFVNNYAFSTTPLTHIVSTTHTTTSYKYGTDYYWNTEKKYTTGTWSSSPYQNYTAVFYSEGGLQIDDNTLLINISANPGASSSHGLYKATYGGLTKVNSNQITRMKLLDGNVICRTLYQGGGLATQNSNTLAIIDKTSYAELHRYPSSSDNSHRIHFLGKIDSYYYVITIPSSDTVSGEVKFVVLNSSDLSVVFEKQLPDDPFNEDNGKATFWVNGSCTPQISNTGFLAFSRFVPATLSLRIARFSAFV